MAPNSEPFFKNGWPDGAHHLVNRTSALVAGSSSVHLRLFFSPGGINSALLLNSYGSVTPGGATMFAMITLFKVWNCLLILPRSPPQLRDYLDLQPDSLA